VSEISASLTLKHNTKGIGFVVLRSPSRGGLEGPYVSRFYTVRGPWRCRDAVLFTHREPEAPTNGTFDDLLLTSAPRSLSSLSNSLPLVDSLQLNDVEGFEAGQQLDVSEMFQEGAYVDVAGKSIGKGFQGTIKRYNMRRGLMTHGSKSHREHGSIGSANTGEGGRIFPGVRMAGRMGDERVTIKNLQILAVDKEVGAIVLKGAVPGKAGNVLTIVPAKND